MDPVVRLHYVEVATADLGEGRSDLQLLLDALDEQWSLDRPGGGHRSAGRPAAGPGRRPARRHGRCPRRQLGHRGLARFRRPGLRRRRRRRLDDHRRPPLRARQRRGAGDGRSHEPPDPLRRGPDEPGVVRDDEPRRTGAADGGGAAGGRRAGRRAHRGRPASSGTTCSTWWPWATRSCTTSCSASIRRRWGRRRSRWPPTCPWTPGPRTSAVGCRRARLHLLPCIAGHVGADAAAAILAEGPHRSDDVQLLVDVGTNAEIVLGCRSWLLAASSPTGPALEGAQISCGQRATPGAIERVRIDRDTLEPRYRVVGSDIWSDDAALRGEPARRRRHRGVRLRDHRGRRRAVPGRGARRRRHHRRRARPIAPRGSSPDGRVFAYVLRDARRRTGRRCASRRTTSAPSSSPRPRCRPASGC